MISTNMADFSIVYCNVLKCEATSFSVGPLFEPYEVSIIDIAKSEATEIPINVRVVIR